MKRTTAQTMIARHGKDFYSKIGRIGGKKSKGGGFNDKELASKAGKKGGLKSRRKSKIPTHHVKIGDYVAEYEDMYNGDN